MWGLIRKKKYWPIFFCLDRRWFLFSISEMSVSVSLGDILLYYVRENSKSKYLRMLYENDALLYEIQWRSRSFLNSFNFAYVSIFYMLYQVFKILKYLTRWIVRLSDTFSLDYVNVFWWCEHFPDMHTSAKI